MRRVRPLLFGVLMILALAAGAYAQESSPVSSLTANLSKEEQLLGTDKPITAEDITRLEALIPKIRTAKDPALLSRAELLVVLFRERETTKAATAALDSQIVQEARQIRRFKWHRTKDVLVKTGFWTGLSSLGLLGASQVVLGWTTDQFVQQPTASAAAPYFITGQVTQLTSGLGLIGAVGGLGMAWLLSINPFDIPAPLTASGIAYPRSGMTTPEKISYLETTKKHYQKQEKGAKVGRQVSFAFLAGGLTGALATGIVGYLGNLEYQKYAASTTAADATTFRTTVTTYEYITMGTAALAFLGLTGATIGYLFGPDPAQLSSSIQALDSQLKNLKEER